MSRTRSDFSALQGSLDELRANTLRWVAVFAVPTEIGFLVLAALDLDLRQRPGMWAMVTCIAGTGLLVHHLARRAHPLAAPSFVGGLLATILIVLIVCPGTYMIYALALVSLAAGIFLEGVACAGVSILTAALAAAITLRSVGPWSPAEAGPLLVLIVACGLMSWLGSRSVGLALYWYGSSYQHALETAEALRQHRAELVRLSQQLTIAVSRLEDANHQLDRARREAEAARRLKTEFATAISHELRTPLNLVIGFSEMLLRATSSSAPLTPAQLSSDIEAIHRNASHITDLINDVLDLSRIEAHRLALRKQPMLLQDVVAEAVEAVRGLFEVASLDLRTCLAQNLPPINADPVRIRQVLINLLANAARHTDEGIVEVKAWREENQVIIAVRDTGVGIAAEDLPWVFEEFRQTGDPRRRRGGSGIGLTVSRYFVEMHGGNIWVESTPGVGTTFFFTLPLQDQILSSVATPDRDRLVCAAAPPRDRILVVTRPDSEPYRLFQSYLDGYEVDAAGSLEEATRFATTGNVRALILPEHPPSLDLARPASITPSLGNLPVISCPLRAPAQLADLGVAAYLVKPISREALVATIRQMTRHVRTVLVVDDDPDLCDLLARIIRQEFRDCHVLQASDGVQAQDVMRTKRPQLVLLDLMMDGSDGYDVLAARRDDPELRAIPVIVVSARGAEDEMITAGSLTVWRPRGLSVADVMRCTRACIGAILTPPDTSDPVPPKAPVG